MDKHKQLYDFMVENYKEKEYVTGFLGEGLDSTGTPHNFKDNADSWFQISLADFPERWDSYSNYDQEHDTLIIWGRGIGIVYKEGQWAMKADGTIPIMSSESTIYPIF